jgi:hypothetical protein
MGADRVLGVSTPPSVRLDPEQEPGQKGLSPRGLYLLKKHTRDWRLPFLIARASFGIAAQAANHARLAEYPPDLLIEIRLPTIGVFSSNGTHGIIETGRKVAMEHLEAGVDPTKLQVADERTQQLQAQLWEQAIALSEQDVRAVTTGLFLESLNEVIDLHTKRVAALHSRVPEVILLLLYVVAVVTIAMLGYGTALSERSNLVPTFIALFLVASSWCETLGALSSGRLAHHSVPWNALEDEGLERCAWFRTKN